MLRLMSVDLSSLVTALRRRLHAEQGDAELVETHISWVLLAGPHAYKLKKPVRFGFLDFSTPERRRHFCHEELRLNQRLAPQLYRGVVDVRLGPDGPAFDGDGPVVDSALWMHRMDPDALASVRLSQGRLTRAEVQQFGRRLAAFHAAAPAAPVDSPWGRPPRVRDDARHAIDALAPLLPRAEATACAALRDGLDAQAVALAPRLDARRRDGRVREGHGDLHLDNVLVLGDVVTAFDCIEFDEGLRWIDTMADLGFVWMDLQARARADLAQALLDAYLEVSGDADGLGLLRFFGAYRAVVRALVAALRAQAGIGADGPAPATYLALAQRLVLPARPALALMHGLPGSGKSWLAGQLLERTGAVRLRSDVERKRLAGLGASASSRANGDLYGSAATDATYARLLALAGSALGDGWPVILDAAWLRRDQRDAARALAVRRQVPFTIFDCQAPMDLLRSRVRQRLAAGGDASEADDRVLDLLAVRAEPLGADERVHTQVVRTDAPVDPADLAARWLGAAGPG
ncbi:MAG: AAA family ATPase [Rubrivivax sp.]